MVALLHKPKPKTLVLRDDQQKAVSEVMDALEDEEDTIFAGATGSGKTVIGGEIARIWQERGYRVFWATHRRELMHQSGYRLMAMHGVFAVVMSPVALRNRLLDRRIVPTKKDILIVDEAHHALARTWRDIIRQFSAAGARVLGLTATPWRLGVNDCFLCLRTHPPVATLDAPVDKCVRGGGFSTLVQGPSKRQLIESGALAPLKVTLGDKARQIAQTLTGLNLEGRDWTEQEIQRAMSRSNARLPVVIKSAVDWLAANGANERRTIVYAVSIGHGERIASEMRAVGIRAEMISSRTPIAERDATVGRFQTGETTTLINVAIATEGFDLPEIDLVMILRATKSIALYLQMAGRAERTADGKLWGDLYDAMGMTLVHGDPAADRSWSLERRLDHGIGRPVAANCVDGCGARLPTRANWCHECSAPQWAICEECGVWSRLTAPLEGYEPGGKRSTPDCERCEKQVAIRARLREAERQEREEHEKRRAAQRADDLTRRIRQRHNDFTLAGWQTAYARNWVLLKMYGVVGQCHPDDRETAIHALAKLVPTLPKTWAAERCEGLRLARDGHELSAREVERTLISLDR